MAPWMLLSVSDFGSTVTPGGSSNLDAGACPSGAESAVSVLMAEASELSGVLVSEEAADVWNEFLAQ